MYDPRRILELEFLLTAKLQEEWEKIAPAQFKPVQDAIAAEDWSAATEAATRIDCSDIAPPCVALAYTLYRGMIEHGASVAAGGPSLTSSLDFDTEVRAMVAQLVQHLEINTTLAAQDAALQLIAEARTVHILKFNPNQSREPAGSPKGGQFASTDGASYKPDPTGPGSLDWATYVAGLGLPPAWTQVWVNPDRNGKLVATGYDKKGRKQPRYSKGHRKGKDAEKFGRLSALNKALPDIRKKLVDGLENAPSDHLAVLRLIERTGIRIGDEGTESDIRDKTTGEKTTTTTYGATTLQARHVRIAKDGTINLEFLGKGGKINTREFKDKALSGYLAKKLEGRAPEDSLFDTNDSAIRRTLKKIVPGFSPKDFRTWHGTNQALKELANHKVAVSDSEMEELRKIVGDKVSDYLNNTRKVALDSYINPAVFDKHTGAGYVWTRKTDDLLDEDDQRMAEFLEGVIWDDLGAWEDTPESEPEYEPENVTKGAPLGNMNWMGRLKAKGLSGASTADRVKAARAKLEKFVDFDAPLARIHELNARIDQRNAQDREYGFGNKPMPNIPLPSDKQVGVATDEDIAEFFSEEHSSVYMAMSRATTLKIIGGDPIKNSLEAGKGTFSTIGEERAVKEKQFLGVKADASDPAGFPKYGFVAKKDDGPDDGIVGFGYGDVYAEFHNTVRDQTTVTIGDSFNGNSHGGYRIPGPINAVAQQQFHGDNPDGYQRAATGMADFQKNKTNGNVKDLARSSEYIEAQLYGRLDASSIKALHVESKKIASALSAAIKKQGLDIAVTPTRTHTVLSRLAQGYLEDWHKVGPEDMARLGDSYVKHGWSAGNGSNFWAKGWAKERGSWNLPKAKEAFAKYPNEREVPPDVAREVMIEYITEGRKGAAGTLPKVLWRKKSTRDGFTEDVFNTELLKEYSK